MNTIKACFKMIQEIFKAVVKIYDMNVVIVNSVF